MFEESESAIRDRLMARVPNTWRKEPGDFVYDTIATVPLEIKELQAQQDYVLQNAFAAYAVGGFLDSKVAEVGLKREAAKASKRTISITADAGVVIPSGYTVSLVILDSNGNPLEFTTDASTTFATAGTLSIPITCKTAGVVGNVPLGSQFILFPPLLGVRTIADGAVVSIGADAQSDDDLYEEYQDHVDHPDTGGNRYDYIRWAKEVEGVGAAKCIPIWNGGGTVKVVIVGSDMLPANASLVTTAQTYLDPGITGLGDGVAPCGAKVTVVSATSLSINISATVTYSPGAVPVEVKTAYQTSVRDYLLELAKLWETTVGANKPVLYQKLSALLSFTKGVDNFSNFTVNGATADITPATEQVAVLGTVTM